MKTLDTTTSKEHPDPLTGEHGSHPLGTGIGATVGGVALGVVGAVTGPIGAVVGVAVGAVLGGLSGKGFAEGYDPTVEDSYWREQHPLQPFATEGDYEDFARAYRTGHGGYREGQSFEEREEELRMEYEGGPQSLVREGDDGAPMEDNLRTHPTGTGSESAKPVRSLEWYSARAAARAAYQRIQEAEEARKNTASRVD